MGVYDRQRTTAQRLIAKYGQEVIWQQRAASGGTAAKPAATVVTPHTVSVAFFPLDREYLKTYQSMMKDTDIPAGLVLGYMSTAAFVPSLKDTVLRGTETLHVADDNGIETIDPNGEGSILYIIRLAR